MSYFPSPCDHSNWVKTQPQRRRFYAWLESFIWLLNLLQASYCSCGRRSSTLSLVLDPGTSGVWISKFLYCEDCGEKPNNCILCALFDSLDNFLFLISPVDFLKLVDFASADQDPREDNNNNRDRCEISSHLRFYVPSGQFRKVKTLLMSPWPVRMACEVEAHKVILCRCFKDTFENAQWRKGK